MDNGSYWHGYLMARHHTFLVLGIAFMVMALISTVTGSTLVKYRGIVSRAENPKAFREGVVTDCVIGFVCFGLFLYTAN
jgi:hypothetical protein